MNVFITKYWYLDNEASRSVTKLERSIDAVLPNEMLA